ncbi:methyltransferase-like protein 22 [Spodoptera frugiperda]|uniref:Methyltransferase-like protein 22 n=2 Tax=Spodoptera frugiperda TaxID=7108 RepID=A0A9R0D993_SPOFR|nr:methyltransferase-like protein 22 [Spodoptera frugiperda]XP_035445174.2 methyltransferase-like protein 22 [Spodoptera frugiperda]XP_035445176.2 methyltransferase-like protein 22 [Spodoptera frugiperda]XP_050549246.1 methyltransferase-like protein 22 [Spodoptera frugiperda]
MPELTVTSEIYEEYDYKTKLSPSTEGNVISEFPFLLPKAGSSATYDDDDDLDIERPQKEVIKIEHSSKTKIALVGLQVWRGAFLLGDWLIHLGLKGELTNRSVLELGAGTGLTSFVAALYAKKVICTDINMGGILDLIKLNAKYNKKLVKSQFKVMPLDFTDTAWSPALLTEVKHASIIIAADVIYDDDLTAAFVSTIQKILNTEPPKTLYMVLEKRYVFTIEHLDSVAPCYETFLTLLDKVKTENAHSTWDIQQLPLDFPKYFTYDRVKDLVLWKISSTPI